MNKKLVIFIVTIVVILSVTFVAVFGSESFGKYHKIKMDTIFFMKMTARRIPMLPSSNLGQEEIILKWGIPDNADVKFRTSKWKATNRMMLKSNWTATKSSLLSSMMWM